MRLRLVTEPSVNHSPLDVGENSRGNGGRGEARVVRLLVSEGCGRLPLQGGARGSGPTRANLAGFPRDRPAARVCVFTCTGRFVVRNRPARSRGWHVWPLQGRPAGWGLRQEPVARRRGGIPPASGNRSLLPPGPSTDGAWPTHTARASRLLKGSGNQPRQRLDERFLTYRHHSLATWTHETDHHTCRGSGCPENSVPSVPRLSIPGPVSSGPLALEDDPP